MCDTKSIGVCSSLFLHLHTKVNGTEGLHFSVLNIDPILLCLACGKNYMPKALSFSYMSFSLILCLLN